MKPDKSQEVQWHRTETLPGRHTVSRILPREISPRGSLNYLAFDLCEFGFSFLDKHFQHLIADSRPDITTKLFETEQRRFHLLDKRKDRFERIGFYEHGENYARQVSGGSDMDSACRAAVALAKEFSIAGGWYRRTCCSGRHHSAVE